MPGQLLIENLTMQLARENLKLLWDKIAKHNIYVQGVD